MVGDEDEDQGELSFWDKDGQEFGKNVIRGRLSYIEVLKRRALKNMGYRKLLKLHLCLKEYQRNNNHNKNHQDLGLVQLLYYKSIKKRFIK